MVRVNLSPRGARSRWIGVVVMAAVLVGGASVGLGTRRVLAQGSRQIFLSVLDAAGAPIADLTAADVTVLEGDAEGKTVKVEPINWPMKVTVLVDNGTKSNEYLPNLRTGLKGLLEALPKGAEGQLVSLAPQPRFLVRPTTDGAALVKGLDLVAPDPQAAKFFDGLTEAGTRIEKEKGNYFPVIVMVTSDVGDGDVSQRDFQKLQKQVTDRAITVHYVALTTQPSGGASQIAVGTGLTQMSGGRFEKINASSRLATLLPEIGQQIAKANERQTHQYRITYEPPAAASNPQKGISIGIAAAKKAVTIKPTLDGRMP